MAGNRRASSIVRHFQGRRDQVNGDDENGRLSLYSEGDSDGDDSLFADSDDESNLKNSKKPDAHFQDAGIKVDPKQDALGVDLLRARKNALEQKFDQQFPHLKEEKVRAKKEKERLKREEEERKKKQSEEKRTLATSTATEARPPKVAEPMGRGTSKRKPKIAPNARQVEPEKLAKPTEEKKASGTKIPSSSTAESGVNSAISKKLSGVARLFSNDGEDAAADMATFSGEDILTHISEIEEKVKSLHEMTCAVRDERDVMLNKLTPVMTRVLLKVGRWDINGVNLSSPRLSPTKEMPQSQANSPKKVTVAPPSAKVMDAPWNRTTSPVQVSRKSLPTPTKQPSEASKEKARLKRFHDRTRAKPIVLSHGLLEEAEKLQTDLDSNHNLRLKAGRKSTIIGRVWGQKRASISSTDTNEETKETTAPSQDGGASGQLAATPSSSKPPEVPAVKSVGARGKNIDETLRFCFRATERKLASKVSSGRKKSKDITLTTASSAAHVSEHLKIINDIAVSKESLQEYHTAASSWAMHGFSTTEMSRMYRGVDHLPLHDNHGDAYGDEFEAKLSAKLTEALGTGMGQPDGRATIERSLPASEREEATTLDSDSEDGEQSTFVDVEDEEAKTDASEDVAEEQEAKSTIFVDYGDAKFDKYRKLMKLHLPEGAIRQKMLADGLGELEDGFFEFMANLSTAISSPLADYRDAKFDKYRKLMKLHLPEGAVRQKMLADGLGEFQDGFFEFMANPPPAESESTAPASSPQADYRDAKFDKYRKLMKLHLPEGAIRQKMLADGLGEFQDGFFEFMAKSPPAENEFATSGTPPAPPPPPSSPRPPPPSSPRPSESSLAPPSPPLPPGVPLGSPNPPAAVAPSTGTSPVAEDAPAAQDPPQRRASTKQPTGPPPASSTGWGLMKSRFNVSSAFKSKPRPSPAAPSASQDGQPSAAAPPSPAPAPAAPVQAAPVQAAPPPPAPAAPRGAPAPPPGRPRPPPPAPAAPRGAPAPPPGRPPAPAPGPGARPPPPPPPPSGP